MRSRMLVLTVLILALALTSACVSSRVSRLPLGTPVPSKTLRPTFTPTTEKPTFEPTPTAAPVEITSPTPIVEDKPTETPTQEPTPTEAPATAQFTVTSATLNVRGGPGTNYAAIGRLTRGEARDITGKNAAGDWWEFDFDGRKGWVSGSLVTATAGGDVQVAANIPAPPTPRPTARPVARPTAQPQQPQPQPQPPPAASTIFGSGSVVLVRDANPPFEPLTFWGRLGPTSGQPISGYSLKVSAPSGERIVPFGAFWERAYSGYPDMEFLQNVKVEVPRTAGAFRAVVIDGSGTEVSDAITGTVTDRTHDVVLGWQKR